MYSFNDVTATDVTAICLAPVYSFKIRLFKYWAIMSYISPELLTLEWQKIP